MDLTQDNQQDYYKNKAHKYFIKYNQLKLKMENNILNGGSKPYWYNTLVEEAKVIYNVLPKIADEPKSNIILTGSMALALLLGNEGMYDELDQAFIDVDDSSKKLRPNDLDLIYQGSTDTDNFNIKSVTIMNNSNLISYKRKEAMAISSVKYLIDEEDKKYISDENFPLIQDFDLTNVTENHKEKPFTKLPFIEIMGIKVLTPEKLLSFYDDNFLEKNINKIEVLTNFITKIKKNQQLTEKYSIRSERYIPEGYQESRFEPSRKIPKLNFGDLEEPSANIPSFKLDF